MPRTPRARWVLAALLPLLPSPVAAAVVLSAADVTAPPGAIVDIGLVLDSQDFAVAGTQNDITVAPPLRFGRRPNGRPDCRVNPEINKGGTSFGFVEPQCGDGECDSVRALVLALDNVDAIAAPVELYRCALAVDESAGGTYPVHLSNPGASDPDGNALALETVDGSVTVGVGDEALIAIGSAFVCGPSTATVEVTYVTGPSLDALQNEIVFEPAAPIAADEAGDPRCTAAGPLDAAHAAFTFRPLGCTPGADCEAVRANLRAELGATAIEGGMVLYRCEVDPTADAAVGSYPLRCVDTTASSAGIPDLVATCSDGSFTVGGCQLTPTPTPYATSEPTRTQPPRGPTQTPTVPSVLGGGTDDDGCAIAPGSRGGAWPLTGALFLWSGARRRRRSRHRAGGRRSDGRATDSSGRWGQWRRPSGGPQVGARRWRGAIAAGAMLWAPTAHAAVLRASDAAGMAGDTVEITVSLDSAADRVAGVQNDIELSPPLRAARTVAGRPDCTVNPDIRKNGTGFSVAACDRGGDCERLRAVVIALDNIDVIPDGSELYRCRVAIDDDALPGSYRIAATNPGASDPDGNAVMVAAVGGRVVVGDSPTALVRVDDTTIRLGDVSPIAVRLVDGAGASRVGVALVLSDALHIISGITDEPHCSSALAGVISSFTFEPDGCSPDRDTCTTMRATISAAEPLPAGAVLFECTLFPVPVIDPGSYPVDCAADAATPDGATRAAFCQSGTLHVLQVERPPTPTPSPSAGTPPIQPTGVGASPTPTAAVRRTTTAAVRAAASDDDGCQVDPTGRGSMAPLLMPAIWLLWRRAGRTFPSRLAIASSRPRLRAKSRD